MRFIPFELPLIKVSATGNDFILVDLRPPATRGPWDKTLAGTSRADWAKLWCDRHEGLGADGAVFLEAAPAVDFAWDFYNSDGSPAEMCGNAARAVSLYVASQTGKSKLKFLSRIGVVDARVESADKIEVALAPIADAQWSQWSDHLEQRVSFDFIRAGVPHVVVRVPNVDSLEDLEVLAKAIKRQERFRKEGTNVTFVQTLAPERLKAVTHERGVEGFTRSCGTGAIAAAYSATRGEDGRTVEVQVPGGTLTVVWQQGRPHLSGPARIVAEMRWMTQAGG